MPLALYAPDIGDTIININPLYNMYSMYYGYSAKHLWLLEYQSEAKIDLRSTLIIHTSGIMP